MMPSGLPVIDGGVSIPYSKPNLAASLVTPTGIISGDFWVIGADWGNSVQELDVDGNTVYRHKPEGYLHCFFGPAIIWKNGTHEWFLFGHKMEEKTIELMKSILEDVKLAPLYINHTVFKYTAKWMLKNAVGTDI